MAVKGERAELLHGNVLSLLFWIPKLRNFAYYLV